MTLPCADHQLPGEVGFLAAGQPLADTSLLWAREGLIIVGGAFLVAVVCFVAVILLRGRLLKRAKRRGRTRSRKKKRRTAHTQSTTSVSSPQSETPQPQRARQRRDDGKHSHRRGRKRRRPRRPQNPTLAETGGLPPKRSHEQAEPGYEI